MALKRAGSTSDLGLEGFLKWVHRFVMFITFPIRNFWLIMAVLIVSGTILLAIPIFCYGVEPRDIGAWYFSSRPIKAINYAGKATASYLSGKMSYWGYRIVGIFTNDEDTLFQQEDGMEFEQREKAEPEPKKVETSPALKTWPVADLKQAKYKPKLSQVDKNNQIILEKLKRDLAVSRVSARKEVPEPEAVSTQASARKKVSEPKAASVDNEKLEEIVHSDNTQRLKNSTKPAPYKADIKVDLQDTEAFYRGKLTDYYRRLENRGLVYLQKPQVLYGAAEVYGPNSLEIDGTFLFLYGIYTSAKKHKKSIATQFLRTLTQNTLVYCAVVAEVAQTKTATALCFSNGVFINKLMVEYNFADNVGLK